MKVVNGKKKEENVQDRRGIKTEEEIKRIQDRRTAKRKLYMQRTRKNQPVTSNRINLLLKQIEKSQGSSIN